MNIEWINSTKEKPPEHEEVLMWYRGTSYIPPYFAVDKWHNRQLLKPDYWAHIPLPECGTTNVPQDEQPKE